MLRRVASTIRRRLQAVRLHARYRDYTMASRAWYVRNMLATGEFRWLPGSVVECGVWRGGMSAGMAEVLGPERRYYLFDSFEGLPPAGHLDGEAAKQWQADVRSPKFYEHCRAGIDWARAAMAKAGARHVHFLKGMFHETLCKFVPEEKIAVLRIDGDWYDSTMACLKFMLPHVAPGGLVILDDYYAWDGCSRAVRDYLSQEKSTSRVSSLHGVCTLELRDAVPRSPGTGGGRPPAASSRGLE